MADESTSPDPSAGMPRERRRSRQSNASEEKRRLAWKHYKVHVGIFVVFAIIVSLMVVDARTGEACPGHWHSTLDVYVDGERISFDHGRFNLDTSGQFGMPSSTHLHRGEDWQWHYETAGGTRCYEFEDAVAYVDMDVEPGRLVLDGTHEELGQAGTWTDNGTSVLRAYHRVGDGGWDRIGIARLDARQPLPDERILVVYGNQSESDLTAWQAAADQHQIQPSSPMQGPSYVAAISVGVIGLIVLGAWHSLSKKAK